MSPVLLRRAASVILVSILGLSGLSGPAIAQATGDLAVVIHRDVPVDNLTIAELRRILLGDREFWSSDQRIVLLLRAPVARERDAVVRTICQMTEAQFRQHWIAKVFRAESRTGPRIVYSSESAADQVVRNPGSLTVLDADLAAKSGRVIRVEGRLPGEPGYALR